MKKTLKYSVIACLSATLLLTAVWAITQKSTVRKVENNAASENEEQLTDDDPWTEMDKIVSAYYSDGGTTYKGTVKVFDDNGETEKLIEENPFEYTLYNEDYHYKLSTLEVVSKKDFTLAVDHNTKTVAIVQKAPIATAQLFDLRGFKKAMEDKKAVVKVLTQGGQKILSVDQIEDPTIQAYRIYYSPATFQVKKIEIGMSRLSSIDGDEQGIPAENVRKEKQDEEPTMQEYVYYLEIDYTSIQTLSLKKEDFHPEGQIIERTNNHIQLTPAFSQYNLVNGGE
jgi:hypothetical protein